MRRQSLNLLVTALQAAKERADVSAYAAPAMRQFSSLVSLQSISSQQWTHSRAQFQHQSCFPHEGHRLFTSGSDLTPEPRVSPGLPAVPTELDEDTIASIVAGAFIFGQHCCPPFPGCMSTHLVHFVPSLSWLQQKQTI